MTRRGLPLKLKVAGFDDIAIKKIQSALYKIRRKREHRICNGIENPISIWRVKLFFELHIEFLTQEVTNYQAFLYALLGSAHVSVKGINNYAAIDHATRTE